MTPPVLVACAHGSSEPAAQLVVLEIVAAAGEALGVETLEAYVDVQEPNIDDVVAAVPVSEDGFSAVVVPLLLSAGYHVHTDIARAVRDRPDVVVTRTLGPDPRLVEIMLEQLSGAGVSSTATVVMGAAGSSDPRSKADTDAAADMLRSRWAGPVRVGFAAGTSPSVAEAVARARDHGEDEQVAVASYLLAPGFFQRRLLDAGADFVTDALAPDPRIIDILMERYRDASGA